DNRRTAQGEPAQDDATRELTGGALRAGRIVESGRGSAATGKVTIGGSAGTASALLAGEVVGFDPMQVGNTAAGEIRIGGSLALTPGAVLRIGTTGGLDRDATFVNEARGHVEIGRSEEHTSELQ